MSSFSRRKFLGGLVAAGAVAALPRAALAAFEPLYPPIDLSYFDSPISAAPAHIQIGYAAITWGGNDRQAIDDIGSLGYSGIQLRSNVVREIPDPNEVAKLLEQHHLTFVALSSGSINMDSPDEKAEIAKHSANARYTHDGHGLYLQMIDMRPKREPSAEDYKKLGRMLTE